MVIYKLKHYNVPSDGVTRLVFWVLGSAYSQAPGTIFFTMLRAMQTSRLSVCLSVRLSVKRMDCDKTKERLVQIFIP